MKGTKSKRKGSGKKQRQGSVSGEAHVETRLQGVDGTEDQKGK